MSKPDGHGGDRVSETARLTTKQREAKVMELRTGGATFDAIAKVLDLRGGASTAHKIFKRALENIPKQAVGEYRETENARLDELEMRLRARLRSGDVSVARDLLAVHDRRVKLNGLYDQRETAMVDLGALTQVFGGFLEGAKTAAAVHAPESFPMIEGEAA